MDQELCAAIHFIQVYTRYAFKFEPNWIVWSIGLHTLQTLDKKLIKKFMQVLFIFVTENCVDVSNILPQQLVREYNLLLWFKCMWFQNQSCFSLRLRDLIHNAHSILKNWFWRWSLHYVSYWSSLHGIFLTIIGEQLQFIKTDAAFSPCTLWLYLFQD